MTVCFLLLAGVIAAITALPPAGWVQGGRTPLDALLDVRIGLRHTYAARKALEDYFWDVSNPAHASWGRHLSQAEVDAMVAPPAQHTADVVAWLVAGGAADVRINTAGDWVSGVLTVTAAEALFGTEYYAFSRGTGDVVHRTLAPATLPPSIAALVDVVTPTTRFPSTFSPSKSAESASSLGTNPSSIRTSYQMGDVQATNTGKASGNKQQAAGFLGQYDDPDTDLASFFAEYYPPGKGRKPTIVGPNKAGDAGDEASLDVQYIMAIGANVSTTYWYTPGTRPYSNEPFVVWLTNLTALPDAELPNTVSVSYGDNEWQIEPAYASAMDVLFQKLAVRGTSIIFASGDGGVSGGQSGACRTNDVFVPTFPSGSPFVTSVGATGADFKTAASFSSGGFSNFYPAPAYQQAVITHYKQTATGLPKASHYNATGRGFPDVSTVGVGFWIFCQGLDEPVDGTSCAAPTFTGIVSLLNDARLAAGKSPLGYLNQLLYAHPEVFTDITAGHNPGCGTLGFPASAGWDPVTGLGTPNFPAMLKLAMSLP